MTFRKSILAALVAAVAVPAIASASSSGLTAADIEAGQVYLQSHRTASPDARQVARIDRAESARATASDVTSPEHEKRMESGYVRMTKGAMEGATN